MVRKNTDSDMEEAEYEDFEEDARKKKIVVYGEYDKYRTSTLKRKRIRISLMDLIVGFIILAILGFIGYRSLQGYDAQSRDDIRAGHLALIKEGLDKVAKQGKALPDPFEKKEILANNVVIGVQGFAGEALFAAIGKKVLRDPLDNSYYIYYQEPGTKQYEVMAFLEGASDKKIDTGDKTSILTRAKEWLQPTIEYKDRTPYSIGNAGNILLSNIGEGENTPLNLLISNDTIDLSNVAKYEDIFYLGANCKDILTRFPQNLGSNGNQLTLIDGKITKVYCDMSTEGGGWTLFYANNGHSNSLIKESYVQMREKMVSSVYEMSSYDNPNLAGLLNYNHFVSNGAKEILSMNRSGGDGKWVKFTFDTSASLSWALGKDILGTTSSGCYQIPNNGSWTIVNNDKTIRFEKLGKIMNALGNSWGVSHSEYPCNNQPSGKSIQPHIAFYVSRSAVDEGRTRSVEGIGGKGTENEYRYFIR